MENGDDQQSLAQALSLIKSYTSVSIASRPALLNKLSINHFSYNGHSGQPAVSCLFFQFILPFALLLLVFPFLILFTSHNSIYLLRILCLGQIIHDLGLVGTIGNWSKPNGDLLPRAKTWSATVRAGRQHSQLCKAQDHLH